MVRWMAAACLVMAAANVQAEIKVTETEDEIRIETEAVEAAVRKRGYVTGVYRQTFLDKKTGRGIWDTGWTSPTGSWSPAATKPTATSWSTS